MWPHRGNTPGRMMTSGGDKVGRFMFDLTVVSIAGRRGMASYVIAHKVLLIPSRRVARADIVRYSESLDGGMLVNSNTTLAFTTILSLLTAVTGHIPSFSECVIHPKGLPSSLSPIP